MIYKIKIPGRPVPKARPRTTKTGHTYTPKKTREEEARIRSLWKFPTSKKAVEIDLLFTMEIPKSWPKYKKQDPGPHTSRPDIDNLTKLILDALNGKAYEDDSQVVGISVWKEYGEEPGTEITLHELI